jgi:iron-sulfur cluster assembly protein
MEFADGSKVDKFDRVIEAGGVRVICDMKSYLYLKGMTVDFADTIMSRQFVFRNPNAKSTCGCGTSFSI